MNLKKLVASLLLFTQATNAFAIGQASTQVFADKIKSNAGGTINTNASGTITVPNATDTLVGKTTTDILTNKTLTSPAISGATMSGVTGFPGTSSVDGSGNAIFGGTGNIAGATLIGAAGSADSKSVFELQSTTKGFLPPRMTTAQKNAIVAPTTGLVVYDTDLKSIQVYNGTSWVTAGSGGLSYAADTGAANAYAIAPTPAALAYTTGDTYIFKATNANTTSSTLNVSALGVKNIKTPQVANLPANAILANAIVMVVYDGTQFQIISQQDPSRVSPLTTKGDVHTFSTVDARLSVPGDYGRMVPDSNATTGWRPASYTQFQNGAPTKDYIQYADFENNSTTGWTATGCATVTSGYPNCPGSGGTAFSSANGGRAKGANTSSPAIDSGSNVSGTYALNLATTAAGTIGDGYVSNLYTLDPSDRGATFRYVIPYKQASGTPVTGGTASDTYAVSFYDAANNTFLTPSNPFCFTNTSKGFCTGYVNTQSTTTGLQAFVYSPIAPVGASSILLDDFYLGTSILPTGPPVTDWVAFTPTGSWATNCGVTACYTGFWRRHGDSLDVRYQILLSGAPTSASLTVNLPTGLTIDTTKVQSTTGWAIYGGVQGKAAGNVFAGAMQYNNTTSLSMIYLLDGTTASIMKYGNVTQAAPYTFAAADLIIGEAYNIPISGWTSNVSMLSSTNTGITISKVTATAHTGGFPANSTGTYTTPAGVKYIEVCGVGAGGGGGGASTSTTLAATAGTATTFGTSLISLPGGGIGARDGDGGVSGGAPTINSPAIAGLTGLGGAGGGSTRMGATPDTGGRLGGIGGSSCLGGAGANGAQGGAGNGFAAQADSGGGGGGAQSSSLANSITGSGGGAGTCGCAVINNPSATYTYTVGTHGNGGTTPNFNGGNGADGQLVVKEYYTPNPNVAVDSPYISMGTEGAGTTTLTAASQRDIVTTLSAARTYTLPSGGIKAGDSFRITNTADFALTLQSSGANTIAILNVGTIVVKANINTPAAKADWEVVQIKSKTTLVTTFQYAGGSGGTASGNINVQIERNGDTVTIYNPGAVSTSGTSNTHYDNQTAIPVGYRTATQLAVFAITRNNGAGTTGLALINNSGTMALYRDYAATVYGTTVSCGYQEEAHWTYYSAL